LAVRGRRVTVRSMSGAAHRPFIDGSREPCSRTLGELANGATFCVLPWLHLSTSVDGVWARCCVDSTAYHDEYYTQQKEPAFLLEGESLGCVPNSKYASDNPRHVRGLEEAFNSPAMRRTRLAMLAGQPVAACSYCYVREAGGGQSYRQQMNNELPKRIDIDRLLALTDPDGSVAEFPCYLDLRFGNSCNLACIMCGFPVSSRWGTLERVHWTPANIDPYRGDEEFWEMLSRNATKLRRVYFAGGEPFMQPLHFKALELFISTGAAARIELVYNSNLTLVPDGILDCFRNFESVCIGASCDGTGAIFESIRRGAKWEDFVRNIDLYRQHARVLLQVAPQRDNIGAIGDILEFAESRGLEVDLRNFVHHPAELSVRNLPPEERQSRSAELLQIAQTCRITGRPNEAEQLTMLIAFLNTD
jgi:organic radical activating enzyme